MNKRSWGIIAIILGALLIAAIIYFIFYQSLWPEAVVSQPLTTEKPASTLSGPGDMAEQPAAQPPVSPLKKAEIKPDDLVRMAAAFAERFGSFSNQSDYGNLRDLQIFMTAKMQDWSQNYIKEAKARKADTSIYYGIVTKSILSEAKQFDSGAGQAEILVKTQRRESTGVAGNSATFYQDIVIKYLRGQGVWRVDGVYWQSK